VSSRHTRSLFGVMLAVVFALSAVVVAPASAKLTKSQKVHIRHQLRKAIKKNPKLIRSKSFIKKASLVNFKLPVTIRLRGATSDTNPNRANVDLGTSLGQREVDLGGSLAAEIVFHDSYDGGALGNVDLNILNSPSHSLTSTSIPLLWNTQVSDPTTSWDSNLLGNPVGYPGPGCGNVSSAGPNFNSPTPASGNLGFGFGVLPTLGGGGLPGVPIYATLADYAAHNNVTNPPSAFAPAHLGVLGTDGKYTNEITKVQSSRIPNNNDYVGGNPQPFPYPASSPGAFVQPPSTADTVLRTNALKLTVSNSGTEINQNTTDGVSGSQNIVLGKSGGQANLFGHIPGKAYGIDVTVNLDTQINSIFRVVDQDAFQPLIAGQNWPAAVFSCGQIWSGAVENHIPAVHLAGNLKIAPGLTADGKLRIAKATINSTGFDPARFAVSACLAPYAAYNTEQNFSDTVTPTVPGSPGAADGTVALSALPVNPNSTRPAPSQACNTDPTAFVKHTALGAAFGGPFTVNSLSPIVGDGYTVTNSGSAVSVAADLTVQNVSVDVLIGDV
jgi:hypothetical protein